MRGTDGDNKISPFWFANFFACLCKFIGLGMSLRRR